MARHLRALGVGPEVVVGVFMERSLEMVVGLFAVFKAGGVYLYLDPPEPRERLAFMLAETCAPLVLTQQPLRAEAPPALRIPSIAITASIERSKKTPTKVSGPTPRTLRW